LENLLDKHSNPPFVNLKEESVEEEIFFQKASNKQIMKSMLNTL